MIPSIVLCIVTPLAGATQQRDWRAALDFEVAGAWTSEADLLEEFTEEQLWSSRHTPFAELAGGVVLSAEHVKSGTFSGRWADHPRFPTIHCRSVPSDWRGYKGIAFHAYAEDATGERITLGIASDSGATPYHDWMIADFVVDWTGWREVTIPLANFGPLGSPAGWTTVQGIYFFAKIFDRQPNPHTVLHLDGMRLIPESIASAAPPLLDPERPRAPNRSRPSSSSKEATASMPDGRAPITGTTTLPVASCVPAFDPSVMNHRWPELREPAVATAPIQYLPYFRRERALFGYYPRFQPGVVSVSPGGQAWVRYAGHVLQTMGRDGDWVWRSVLDDVLVPYARDVLGFKELTLNNMGSSDDASIRWDADGDAYKLCFVSDPTGNWRTRTGVLLHSRDNLQTWDVYRLPWYMARLEKALGHNRDRLKRPPVILMARYFAPTQIFITIPRKRADGTLEIPEPVLICEDAMPMSAHSGEAGMAATVGDTVFMVYGRLAVLDGHTKEDGAPAYAVTYDISTGTLSEPVLIGFGGKNAKDNHNWPALTVDSRGHLHVIVNGHHDPFRYTRSVHPLDIGAWTEPETVAKGTTYAGLLCDSQDTLYSVTRHADPGYYFRLSLHRKRAGQPWEAPKNLVVPHNPYYEVYYHKLVMDPVTERLFLCYWSQSASICLFRDEFRAYAYVRPDREIDFLSVKDAVLPIGAVNTKERKYQFYSPKPSEPSILVSHDHGDTWRLAVSADFAPSPGRARREPR
jgi:hypothetical protein